MLKNTLKPITNYLFGKINRKGKKEGKGTKIYIAVIYTILFGALFVTYV